MALNTGGGKRTIIRRVHYISGCILSLFIVLHLLNHLIALHSISAHIQCMDAFRNMYRHPVVETLLLLCVLFQIVSGLTLVFSKQAKQLAEKVQIYSGLYLSFFLIVHVGAVLYGRYMGLDTNFYFAATGMNYTPYLFLFIPYYFLAVASITLHVSAIHYIKTGSRSQAYSLAIVGILSAVLIIMAFTNKLQGYQSPVGYQNFLEEPFKVR